MTHGAIRLYNVGIRVSTPPHALVSSDPLFLVAKQFRTACVEQTISRREATRYHRQGSGPASSSRPGIIPL